MQADWNLTEAIEYYRGQNVSQDQQALIELLREVQSENGGSIPACALEEITAQLDIRPAILTAILKRCPGLRTQTAPHSLELCAGPRCQKRECARLHAFIEKNYQAKNGGISAKGGFSYRLTGCMKNCANGPSMKWDGKLYSQATPELLRSLIEKGKSNTLR